MSEKCGPNESWGPNGCECNHGYMPNEDGVGCTKYIAPPGGRKWCNCNSGSIINCWFVNESCEKNFGNCKTKKRGCGILRLYSCNGRCLLSGVDMKGT